MRTFKKYIQEDIYSLYSMPIPADLSEKKLKPYINELMNVIIIESREKNLIIKVTQDDELANES